MKTLKISALVLALLAGTSAFAVESNGGRHHYDHHYGHHHHHRWSGRDRDTIDDRMYRAMSGCWRDSQNSRFVGSSGERWSTGVADSLCDEPRVVAPPPAPKPVIVRPAPVPKPVIERMTLSSKVLFAFDRSMLSSGAHEVLDPIAARLRSDPYLEMVEVHGHTDYLGRQAYNMKLSQRRAEAVRQYLVNAGVPAGKIVARGYGETQEQMSQVCRSKYSGRTRSSRRSLHACLEPDRRVDLLIKTARKVMPGSSMNGGGSVMMN